jgi:hypothetical protein
MMIVSDKRSQADGVTDTQPVSRQAVKLPKHTKLRIDGDLVMIKEKRGTGADDTGFPSPPSLHLHPTAIRVHYSGMKC